LIQSIESASRETDTPPDIASSAAKAVRENVLKFL